MSLQILDTESELSVSFSAKRFVPETSRKTRDWYDSISEFVRHNEVFKMGDLALFARLKIELCKEIIILKMY